MKKKSIFKRFWKETEEVGFVDLEYFTEWLDYLDLSFEVVAVNGEIKKVEDFRHELYKCEGFLYVVQGWANQKDNSFIIKDNLDREFHIQDVTMLEHTVELIDMPEYIELPDYIEDDELPL